MLHSDDCYSRLAKGFMRLADLETCSIACTLSPPKSHKYWPSPSLEQFVRAIWGAVSWASVLILPQIKLSCTSHVRFFKSTIQRPIHQDSTSPSLQNTQKYTDVLVKLVSKALFCLPYNIYNLTDNFQF